MWDVREKLLEEGIKVNSFGQVKTTCPKCSHTRSKNKYEPCLSVNVQKDMALWQCHHCDDKGAIYDKEKKGIQGLGREFLKMKPKVVEIFNKPPSESERLSQNAKKWLSDRKISLTTAMRFGIYSTNSKLCFPYWLDGEVVNNKYRTREKRFSQEKDATKSLYNIDMVKEHWELSGHKSVIFVEGEMDVLSMFEVGYRNTVTLPDGAGKTAKFNKNDKRFSALQTTDWIFEAEEVIIATDNDTAGHALKLELIHRFGKDICKVVKFPKHDGKYLKDANEVLTTLGIETLQNCVENAEEFPIEDVHSVHEYEMTVQDMYEGNVQRAFSTGFEKLDQIYKVMPSTFNLITGIPNHGKSNFLDQILMNLANNNGWKFIIYSPEHSTPNHIRRLVEKKVQKPFDISPYPRINQDELNDGLKFLNDHFMFIENSSEIPNIDYILEKAKIAKRRYSIDGLVIDPYNQISPDREGNKREDEHIRDIIAKCQSFARNYHVVIWMVAHPHKLHRNENGVIPPPDLYQVSGSSHWANMCDVGMVIHRDFEENITKVITRKIREQGVYGEIGQCEFYFNFKTRSYNEN